MAEEAAKRGRLGLIGGSGLYKMAALDGGEWRTVETPWGSPSDAILLGEIGGREIAFLPRHGRGHRIAPDEINARANIAALKMLGCTELLAVSAVGSFREELPAGTFVLVDQFIDRTVRGGRSFLGGGIVGHVAFGDPTCGSFARTVAAALGALGLPHRIGGTMLVMEGPQFSTRAESLLHKAQGLDVVGMTGMPEARLAREAGLCYQSVAMVTDLDAWIDAHVEVAEILSVLGENASNAQALIGEVCRRSVAAPVCANGCAEALDTAIVTDRSLWPEAARAAAGSNLAGGGMSDNQDLTALIRTIPDFPKPGIQFRDITTLLLDGPGFAAAVDRMAAQWQARGIDLLAGIEARGFVFGAALAQKLGLGLLLIRKDGKLPGATVAVDYALEYGQDRICMHADALLPGARVLIVDDLIATGGTALAACRLLREAGGEVIGAAFVVDLPDIGGAAKLREAGLEVTTLVAFEGD